MTWLEELPSKSSQPQCLKCRVSTSSLEVCCFSHEKQTEHIKLMESCSCIAACNLNIEFLQQLGFIDNCTCGMNNNSSCRAPTPGKHGVRRVQFDFAHVRKVASEGKRSEHREVPCQKSCFQFQQISLRLTARLPVKVWLFFRVSAFSMNFELF